MNMQAMMAQAQRMQRDIEKKKKEVEESIYTGESEWVLVEFNGKRKLKKLTIKYNDDISNDEKDILEDMISIAINDAFKKIDSDYNKKLGSYGNMLNGLL